LRPPVILAIWQHGEKEINEKAIQKENRAKT
jgi:hypothetical protein